MRYYQFPSNKQRVGSIIAPFMLTSYKDSVEPPFLQHSSDVNYTQSIRVTDTSHSYVIGTTNKTTLCVIEGTYTERSGQGRACACKPGWHGVTCGIPEGVINSEEYGDLAQRIILRNSPRRVICAFPFNMEFDMLEARFAELEDVVDVYVILESNYSAAGEQKPLRLLERLRQGYYSNLQHKIVYVHLGYFPEAAYKNGWIIDDLLRDYIGMVGMKSLKDVRPDDLFLLVDADEIPRKNEVLFLKLHDGYSEPVGFHVHFTSYGFFFSPSTRPSMPIVMATSVAFLNDILGGRASRIRNPSGHLSHLTKEIELYESKGHPKVKLWFLGNARDTEVGWHCSWCFNIRDFQIKMLSAQRSDAPRWGNFPEKLEPEYLKSMIRDGAWFDGSRNLRYVPQNYSLYAPKYILSKPLKFKHLLKNLYLQ